MKRLLAMLLILWLTTVTALASPPPSGASVPDLLSGGGAGEVAERVPPQAQELLEGDAGDISGIVESVKPESFTAKLWGLVKRNATAPLRLLVSLCGIMILSAMLEIWNTALASSGSVGLLRVVIGVAVASIIVSPVVGCITEAAVTLRDFSLFITTFIPVFAGVLTAAGQPLTAAAYNIFLFWICQVTSQLIAGCFVPLLCAYLALAVISVACPALGLARLVGGLRTFVVWGLTLTLTVFVGLLSVQSVVAASGDNVTVKAAKFMIGSLVPGVGGALSDLFMAAQGCIQVAKGTLGAFGVVVTLFTFLPIMIKVLLWYLSLNVASLLGGILGVNELSALLKSISSTLGILLAVLLYDALLVIISTTIIIVSFKAG